MVLGDPVCVSVCVCQTIVLHYLSHGAAYLSFTYHKRVYLAPIILLLKALKSECDKYVFDRLMAGHEDDAYYRGFVAATFASAVLFPDKSSV